MHWAMATAAEGREATTTNFVADVHGEVSFKDFDYKVGGIDEN